MSDALYHALIVEHDRAPRHHGPLAGATHTATLDNPMCGDVVTMRAIVARDGDEERIVDAKFEARGCALCRAAASMLTSRVIDQPVDEVRALLARFVAFVSSPDDDPQLGELVAFAGVKTARSRRTCATLPFRALASALGSDALAS